MSDINTWKMQSASGLPGRVPRFVVAIFCATVIHVLAWTSLISWIRKAGAPGKVSAGGHTCLQWAGLPGP
jgi:hypothetical protein